MEDKSADAEEEDEMKEEIMPDTKKPQKSAEKEEGKKERRHTNHRFHAGLNSGSTNMQPEPTENYWT